MSSEFLKSGGDGYEPLASMGRARTTERHTDGKHRNNAFWSVDSQRLTRAKIGDGYGHMDSANHPSKPLDSIDRILHENAPY